MRTMSVATGLTVTETLAGEEETPALFVTTSWKINTACGCPKLMSGAVNEGLAVFAPLSTTGVPLVWVQANVSGRPAASVPLPWRVTIAPEATVWFAPAFAVVPPATLQVMGVGCPVKPVGHGLICPT